MRSWSCVLGPTWHGCYYKVVWLQSTPWNQLRALSMWNKVTVSNDLIISNHGILINEYFNPCSLHQWPLCRLWSSYSLKWTGISGQLPINFIVFPMISFLQTNKKSHLPPLGSVQPHFLVWATFNTHTHIHAHTHTLLLNEGKSY